MRMPRVALRRAELKDSDLVLAWRNDPEAIRQSETGLAVETVIHEQWFKRAVKSSGTVLLIAEEALKLGSAPIGMCRFDFVKVGVFAVSINLGPDFRGRGLGREVLQSAISFLEGEVSGPLEIEAVVHESNSPSLRIFEKVDFSVFTREGPWLHLRLSPQSQ